MSSLPVLELGLGPIHSVIACRLVKRRFVMSRIKRRVVNILKDDYISEEEKVTALRQMEADTLGKERSANEGMMPVEGDDGEDLKAIEMALRKLGQLPVDGGGLSL